MSYVEFSIGFPWKRLNIGPHSSSCQKKKNKTLPETFQLNIWLQSIYDKQDGNLWSKQWSLTKDNLNNMQTNLWYQDTNLDLLDQQ